MLERAEPVDQLPVLDVEEFPSGLTGLMCVAPLGSLLPGFLDTGVPVREARVPVLSKIVQFTLCNYVSAQPRSKKHEQDYSE